MTDRFTVIASSPTPKSSSKKVKLKQKSPEPRHGSSLQPLEYIPFTPWPWPISRPRDKALSNPALDRPDSSDENGPFAGEVEQRSGSAAVSFSRNIREGEIHPFLLAREIFLRLIWAHAENLNEEARNLTVSTYINLHNLDPPATLPPHSLSRLMDPDGDGLGHLSGVPKWFGALEGALKRRFGFGLGDGLGVASGFGFSSTVDSEGREMAPSRAEAVDEVFGYPKDSIPLPRLTPTAFHHYILLLGLSAPEPWEFTQAGWRQRHPFEGYPLQGSASPPEPSASSASKSAASSGPFTGCTSTTSSGNRFQAKTLIPGPAEIPVALAYMRALRLIPTRDTICAAVVFWKEAVGGETLFDLGLRDIREYRDARRNVHTSEAGDAYVDEFEEWKASVENIGSGDISERSISGGRRGVQVGEYARFCRWIREWVDEVNANLSEDVKGGLKMTMPHPYHIHRWTGIVRKMREGQGYEEGEREAEEEEEKEDESRKDGKAGGAS
ncbi:hypothetical protein GYMLUDRAFT_753028 [Collybiopsis luxurians FD-317 M1]|uniref:Uncharacterized protein n=1 Tax=Collybiopsis luxurians FD-317 M1 TaxID=944289 RepID=A0A0D0B308_9AGAR|nr:hypothetical protein GYMLUDRAFT_753028 [Collybiopsis luxurians FD-317 M1]